MMMRVLVLLALLFVPLALAQGPAPGHTPLSYAEAYAQQTAEKAVDEPTNITLERVGNETAHAAWLACWTLDDAGAALPVCDAFYTRPQNVEPDVDENATDVDETVAEAEAYVANVTEEAVGVLEDPKTAPDRLARVLEATKAFLDRLASGVVDVAKALAFGIIAPIAALVGAFVAGLLGALAGLADLGGLGLSASLAALAGITALFGAIGDLAGAVARGLVSFVAGAGMAIADAAEATGSAIAAAAIAIAQGIAAGATAVADGVSTAASALADAARSAVEAIGSWFAGESPADVLPERPADVVEAPGETVDGLLESLEELA